MAYSVDQAEALAKQFDKFTTSWLHHLVGQFANLDFWLDEASHALKVLDDYPRRFVLMRDAQGEWVKAHATVAPEFCPFCHGACEFGRETPRPPTRIASQDLDAARRRVKDSTYQLLLRCHRAGLLDEAVLRAACARVGTSVDLADLK